MKPESERWAVCGMLFLATVISYIDRQTMSVVAPVIAKEFQLSNEQIANILSAFLFAYAFGQVFAGRFLDWTGTRTGFAISISFWSLANMLTAFVTRPWGFSLFRFLLGVGEAGNYPGGVKAIAEWFPPHERTFAGGLFTSGASVGAVIAAPLVASITHYFGWRVAFVVTGAAGFAWLAGWLLFYRTPVPARVIEDVTAPIRWRDLFRRREVWALTIARFLEEPLIWLAVFWLPKYMVDIQGLSLLEMGWVLTIPFLALDAGYISGGWVSSRLMRSGVERQRAKWGIMLIAAILMGAAVPAAFAGNLWVAVAFISVAVFGHGSWFSNIMTMPSDLVPHRLVASVYGISGMGGGVGGIVFTQVTGMVVDRYHSFTPVLVAAGLLPMVGTLVLKYLGGSMGPVSKETIS